MKKFQSKPILYIIGLTIILLSPLSIKAQKSITFDDLKLWRQSAAALSDDGNWYSVKYSFTQLPEILGKDAKSVADSSSASYKEDGRLYGEKARTKTLYVRNFDGLKEYSVPWGDKEKFSFDSKWIAYTIVDKEEKKAEANIVNKPATPKKKKLVKVELKNLETGETKAFDSDGTYSFVDKTSLFLVKTSSGLIIHYLDNPDKPLFIGQVDKYSFNETKALMAYTINPTDSSGSGIYIMDINEVKQIFSNSGKYKYGLVSWNKKGDKLAIFKSAIAKGKKFSSTSILIIDDLLSKEPISLEMDTLNIIGFPEGKVIDSKQLSWNDEGSRVFFSIMKQKPKDPKPKKEVYGDSLVANVDLWHWNDKKIQSQQIKEAVRAPYISYKAVINIEKKQFLQLTFNESMRTSYPNKGEWIILSDSDPYISDWDINKTDYYRMNLNTGKKNDILKAHVGSGPGNFSPDGKLALYWNVDNYFLYDIESDKHHNLTANSPISFVNYESDATTPKGGYSIEGWTKDAKNIILCSKYDIWLQPLNGKSATCLTMEQGKENEIRFGFTYQMDDDPDDKEALKTIDHKKTLIISAFGKKTKYSGYYSLKKGKFEKIIYEAKKINNIGQTSASMGRYGRSRLKKAKYADRIIFNQETVSEYPEFYLSDLSFGNIKKISNTNPQQSNYKWGTRIIFDYTDRNGFPLQGILAIPDDYKAGQKLPMIVEFYEQKSDLRFRHLSTRHATGPVPAHIVSNGYLYMEPDIKFNGGTSYFDILDGVESAVKKVIELGYADPDKIGLKGHSWSGEGASFISTQSKMFAAVMAGAGVSDPISDYNADIWSSNGTSQHRHYHHGQGRIDASPHTDLDLYLEQSTVLHAKDMNTPLLLYGGTYDGIVPWIQPFGFYNALRFNKKPVIFLSYRGEPHGLRQAANKQDAMFRAWEFFEHYLNGKPPSDWIVNGILFRDRKIPTVKEISDYEKIVAPWY